MAEDGGYFDEFRTRPIAYMVEGKCWVNNHAHVLRAREGFDAKWFYYSLVHKDVRPFINAGTRSKLNQRDLIGIPVFVPPLPEQGKIAAILSSVDNAIEKTQAAIDQVQVVKRGMMQEFLTRGLPGRHTRFKQTEIGEIPDSWRTSRIGEIASCDYGTSNSLQGNDSGIPILRMGNLIDGRVSLNDVKYLAAEKVPEELLLSSGDVLFNRTNSAELVGKVAVFDHQVRASFASYLLRLRVDQVVGCGFWLSYLLNTETIQRKLRATATLGVSQVNINRKSLLGSAVPVPPVEEQAEIVSILNSVSSNLEVKQKWVDHLKGVKPYVPI